MQKLVSIIIPVYNHQDALERALASIEKQTYTDIEVIVVDDGSETEIQISNFKFLIRLQRQNNLGAPVARNKGLELSHGEYVIFWDADVVAESDMLEKMVHALEQNPEASFVYSNHYFGKKKMSGRVFDVESLQKINYIHSTSLIRRKDAVRWDESLKRFQDWDLWLTMVEQGKSGVWIDEYLFRVETGGTMSSWLPRFAYKKPWSLLPGVRGRVRRYEEAKDVVVRKHGFNVASSVIDIKKAVLEKRAKIGETIFVAIDGHGGSGKSTLASMLAEKLHAEIIHTDDFASWDNPLDWWPILIEKIFEPIAAGATSLSYPCSQGWSEQLPAITKNQSVTSVMIVEGVSSMRKEFAKYISMGIFVDTPKEICLQRGIERDLKNGKTREEVQALWEKWFEEEDEYMKRDQPHKFADIVIDGTIDFDIQIR